MAPPVSAGGSVDGISQPRSVRPWTWPRLHHTSLAEMLRRLMIQHGVQRPLSTGLWLTTKRTRIFQRTSLQLSGSLEPEANMITSRVAVPSLRPDLPIHLHPPPRDGDSRLGRCYLRPASERAKQAQVGQPTPTPTMQMSRWAGRGWGRGGVTCPPKGGACSNPRRSSRHTKHEAQWGNVSSFVFF